MDARIKLAQGMLTVASWIAGLDRNRLTGEASRPQSNDASLAQAGDRIGVVAESAEHGIGVLTPVGGPRN